MKRITLLLIVTFSFFELAVAQVGIGTPTPESSAQLDVVSEDKGILIPRVKLESTTDDTTISSGNVNSLLVFNTETNADMMPGYYYWYDGSWRKIADTADELEETITTLIEESDGVYVYTSEDGTETEIDIPDAVVQNIIEEGEVYIEIINLIEANETITILQDNGNGSYTYYNEADIDEDGNIAGTGVTIDVVNDVVQNIINEGDIYNEIINMLDGEYGNVFYDETTNEFYYIDDNGDEQPVDWSDFNTVNQSFELVNDELVITDSDGNAVALAVEEIANNTIFITELTENQEFIDEIINMLDGEYGNVFYDETTNEFYYIDDNGDEQPIDWSDFNTVNQSFTLENDQLVITDSDGNTVELAVEEIANNDTFITELTENQNFIDEIINMLEGEYGNVVYDETTNEFYYIDDNGDEQPIDWSDFNTVNESFDLVNDQLVITDSDGGTVELNTEEIAGNLGEDLTTDDIIQINDSDDDDDGEGALLKAIKLSIKPGDINSVLVTDENGEVNWGDQLEIIGTTITKNTEVNYTGDIIDGLPVVAFEGVTHINENEALTSGVDLAGYLPAGAALEGVVSIRIYQNGSLVTSSTTDVEINGAQINFNIGIGNMYQILPEGDYEVIVYATLDQ